MKVVLFVAVFGLAATACGPRGSCDKSAVTQLDIVKEGGGSYVTDGSACAFMNSGSMLVDGLEELHQDMISIHVDAASVPKEYSCADTAPVVRARLRMKDSSVPVGSQSDYEADTCTFTLDSHPKPEQAGKATGSFNGRMKRVLFDGTEQFVTVRFNFNAGATSSAPE